MDLGTWSRVTLDKSSLKVVHHLRSDHHASSKLSELGSRWFANNQMKGCSEYLICSGY